MTCGMPWPTPWCAARRPPPPSATGSSPPPSRPDVAALADWLAVADRALDAGARPGLRLELPDGPDGEFRATVQLRSTADASLVIDAADLWDAPAAVLARMGDDADSDLFLALRRGAQAWPPLSRLLDESPPGSAGPR